MILGRFRLLIVLVSFVTVVLLLVFFGFGSEPIGTLSAKRLGTGTNLLDDVANSTLGVRQSIGRRKERGKLTQACPFCSSEKSTP